ncbi:MAG: hypothetical protein J6Y28_08070 [Acholeplasmatales bacterium]|nr:hypothetical protein [Acholeplasmatales bacterium]
MIKDLQKLADVLDTKVAPLVEAIEKADPTKEEYGIMLSNFNATMTVATNIGNTLVSVAKKVQEIKDNEKKDEENK